MFQAKQIAAVLIAVCFVGAGEAATRPQPPGAAQNVTIQPSGRAYLFRGFIGASLRPVPKRIGESVSDRLRHFAVAIAVILD
jgi:hypothetical protein